MKEKSYYWRRERCVVNVFALVSSKSFRLIVDLILVILWGVNPNSTPISDDINWKRMSVQIDMSRVERPFEEFATKS